MTRIFYDAEFLEDGSTIELISLALVSEPGDEYYAVNRDFRWHRIAHRRWYAPWLWNVRQPWLVENVVPSLPKLHGDARNLYAWPGSFGIVDWRSPLFKPHAQIADEVRQFIASHPDVELWADYGAYDHVVLCQLWGRMIDLPDGVPMFTRDWQHEHDRLGRPPVPDQTNGEHNALDDARALRAKFLHVAAQP